MPLLPPAPPARVPAQAVATTQPQGDYDASLRQAREAAWHGDRREALAILQPWIAQGRREAILASATYLAWSGRYGEGLARLEGWLGSHPGDGEAALGRAQILAWSGRWAEARRAYGPLVERPATADAALLGLARLDHWNQDPVRARERLARVSPEVRQSPEGRLLAAQVEAVAGHPAEGRREAVVVAALPGMGKDAEPILRGLDDRLGPWVEAGFMRTDTSEGLRTEEPGLRARLPLGDAALDLGWTGRRLQLGPTEARPSEASLGATVPLGPRWVLSGGLRRFQEVDGGGATGFGFHAAFQAAPGLALGYGHERSFTVITPASAALGTALATDALDLHWQITGRQSLALSVDHGSLSAGSTRVGYTAMYQCLLPHGDLQWRWGITSRGFGYSETLPLGFFNPRSYRWNGLTGGAAWSPGPRLALSLEAQAGAQTIDGGAATFSWNYGTRASWTPGGGPATLSASWSQTRAGLPVVASGDPSGYREHTFAFALRLRGGHGRLAP
ncbi:MAG TPA: tetratricopeptide repeat protein [Holophagaceae bacterium]|nr:tetratricopeptide repeat protein [Holophagaceae bacterium]